MTGFQNQVSELTHLTPKQREFITKYISEHGAIKNALKVGSASDFDRRRGKLEQELLKFPDVNGSQKVFQSKLDEADALAEKGEFPAAYKMLKAVKEQAKQLGKQYDPTDDIKAIEQRVSALKNKSQVAAKQYQEFSEWLTEGPSLAKAIKEKFDLRQQESQFDDLRTQLDQDWQNYSSDWNKFLHGLNETVESINSEITNVSRMCEVGKKNSNIGTVRESFSLWLYSEEHAEFREKGSTFFTPEAFMQKAQQQRNSITQLLAGHLVGAMNELNDDQNTFQDGTGKNERIVPEGFQSFMIGDIMQGFEKVLSSEVTRESQEFTELVESAQSHFKEAIKEMQQDTDQFFDLVMKSEDELKNELRRDYAAKQGWPRKWKDLDDGQKRTLEALAIGFFAGIRETSPNKFDDDKAEVTIGGITYGTPRKLTEGGLGAVYRLVDSEGNTVVMKELLDPKKRDEMKREIIANRQLLKGENNAVGKQNILEMKGVVQDENGTLYMIMESAEGDMMDVKGALTGASVSGVLPEMARNVLNQFLFKQSIEGLKYLRDQNMVHFDLKEQNIMIGKDGTPKLGDFGSMLTSQAESGKLSMMEDENVRKRAGGGTTAQYKAPDLDQAIDEYLHIKNLKEFIPSMRLFQSELVTAINNMAGYPRLPKNAWSCVKLIGMKNSYKDFIQNRQFEQATTWVSEVLQKSAERLKSLEEIQNVGTVDTGFDTFSMGRVAQAMQYQTRPKRDRDSTGDLFTMSNAQGMTGAFDRLASGMTSDDPNERLNLESVLESSYLKNLEGYDESVMKSLMAKTVEYGKLIDTGAINTLQQYVGFVGSGSAGLYNNDEGKLEFRSGNLRERLHNVEEELREINDQKLERLQKKLNSEVLELRKLPGNEQQISELNKQLQNIQVKLQKRSEKENPQEELKQQREQLIREIDEKTGEIKRLSEPNEAAKKLKQEIAQLSQELLYPTSKEVQTEGEENK